MIPLQPPGPITCAEAISFYTATLDHPGIVVFIGGLAMAGAFTVLHCAYVVIQSLAFTAYRAIRKEEAAQ